MRAAARPVRARRPGGHPVATSSVARAMRPPLTVSSSNRSCTDGNPHHAYPKKFNPNTDHHCRDGGRIRLRRRFIAGRRIGNGVRTSSAAHAPFSPPGRAIARCRSGRNACVAAARSRFRSQYQRIDTWATCTMSRYPCTHVKMLPTTRQTLSMKHDWKIDICCAWS